MFSNRTILNKHVFTKSNILFIISLSIFLIVGIYLLKYYQYDTGADGMSYISIAKLYIKGDFTDAINGYWGPLFSWLMIPFIKVFGSKPLNALYAARFLSIIIGAFTIVGVRQLSYKFEMNEKIRSLVIITIIPFILFVSLGPIQPDLLIACFLVYYLSIIFDKDYSNKSYNGFLCGLLCAMAYLTKAYALPFFVAHFILFNILHYSAHGSPEKKKSTLKNLFLGLLTFFIISGLWAGTISDKYNELTFGTTGTYNYGVVGPNSVGHPTQYDNEGFIKPPYKDAVSAWEDPSYFKVDSWSPLKTWSYFKYQLSKIEKNFSTLLDCYQEFSYFSLLILIFCIAFCIRPVKELMSKREILYPLLTVLLYPVGYLIISLEIRYLWLVYILILLMGACLLNALFNKKLLTRAGKSVLALIFIFSFVTMPLNGLIGFYDSGKYVYEWSNVIHGQYDIQGNVASNGNLQNGNYRNTLHLSYFLGTSYYGFSKPNETDSDLQADFKKYDIDYYFVWGHSNNGALLSKYKEVSGGKITGLKIYDVKT